MSRVASRLRTIAAVGALASSTLLTGCVSYGESYAYEERYVGGRTYYEPREERYYDDGHYAGDYYYEESPSWSVSYGYGDWPWYGGTYYSVLWPTYAHWYDPWYSPGYYYGVTWFPRSWYGYSFAYYGGSPWHYRWHHYAPYRYSWWDNYYDWDRWDDRGWRDSRRSRDVYRFGSARNEAERLAYYSGADRYRPRSEDVRLRQQGRYADGWREDGALGTTTRGFGVPVDGRGAGYRSPSTETPRYRGADRVSGSRGIDYGRAGYSSSGDVPRSRGAIDTPPARGADLRGGTPAGDPRSRGYGGRTPQADPDRYVRPVPRSDAGRSRSRDEIERREDERARAATGTRYGTPMSRPTRDAPRYDTIRSSSYPRARDDQGSSGYRGNVTPRAAGSDGWRGGDGNTRSAPAYRERSAPAPRSFTAPAAQRDGGGYRAPAPRAESPAPRSYSPPASSGGWSAPSRSSDGGGFRAPPPPRSSSGSSGSSRSEAGRRSRDRDD